MNTEEFRVFGKQMVDYISDYIKNIAQRDVAPTLDPGYLKPLLPDKAPENPENFEDVMRDVEEKIMPGVLHWNHPKFFAYFSSGNSFPSILGDMLSSAIGSIGFSWASCPAATELETIILNWYAKALNLPKFYLSDETDSKGGGALQGSASECTLVCLMAARYRAIQRLKCKNSQMHDSVFLPQLVAYTSKEAHSSVEKAALMAIVKLRLIDTDAHGRMNTELLNATMQNDIKAGLTPFFVVATVGTTGACAFDNLVEIGKICQKSSFIWFHVDGAYAGNAFLLPEMRHFAKGLEYSDSFNTNPNKLLLTNFDASAMWVKDVMILQAALAVNPLYLQHQHDHAAIDYRHYGIPLSRRFRALKLWFVFRLYGITGLQAYIRNHMALAKKFEMLIRKDNRFEVRNDVYLGLVCFRMKTDEQHNQELLAQINNSGKMHMVPSMVDGKYSIRFCVTYEHASERDMVEAWQAIKAYAEEILQDVHLEPESPKPVMTQKLSRRKSLRFSFTRQISREAYDCQINHLRDGCTPILVIDDNYLIHNFEKATILNQTGYSSSNTNGNNKRCDSKSDNKLNHISDEDEEVHFA